MSALAVSCFTVAVLGLVAVAVVIADLVAGSPRAVESDSAATVRELRTIRTGLQILLLVIGVSILASVWVWTR